MLQNQKDALVFFCVGVWVMATMRREWLRLVFRQLKYGLLRVRVAAPCLANEKFLWRKAFDHNPIFVTASDKEAAKTWIQGQGFETKMPKTLWVGTDATCIPESVWQKPFYLKATHGCQMNIAVLDQNADRANIIAEANSFLERDHGSRQRQWAYGSVPRRLIAEEVISPGQELVEVKYYTYGGTVEQFVIRREGPPLVAARWARGTDGQFIKSNEPTAISDIIDDAPLPSVVEEGLALASKIGEHFDHIRVDTLTDGDSLFLGELTVYSIAGRVNARGNDPADVLNRSWDLRKSWFLTTPQVGWRKVYAAALKRRLDGFQI